MKNFYLLILLISLLSVEISAQSGSLPNQNQSKVNSTHLINEIMSQVSEDSIRSYLVKMASFFTRHTNSDTVSETTGIGAARRWVYSKFQEFSSASGGALQPQYFDFMLSNGLHRNVMAILPGTMPQSQDRIFVISGHLDSRNTELSDVTGLAHGVNDDGSGCAVSIELARIMSQYQFDATIIFMCVTGEEQGLLGSEAYAQWASQNNLQIDGMLNNDIVGNITGEDGQTDSMGIRCFSSLEQNTTHRQLSRLMKLIGENFLTGFTVHLIPLVDRPSRGGDHQSFQEAGFTAIRFTERFENLNYQHTMEDLLEHMSLSFNTRVARLNAACLTNLALAPKTPNQPQVFDAGTGTEILVQWTNTNNEPDFAGYRVAVRDDDSLFYKNLIDVGNVNEYIITHLTPDASIYISISAVDSGGYESVFSSEILITPRINPSAPQNFESDSEQDRINLHWSPNPELDINRYRILKATDENGPYAVLDSTDETVLQYSDLSVNTHTFYYYKIQGVDNDGNGGELSLSKKGRLATHDLGVFIVDASRNGFGAQLFPRDTTVDNFYNFLLQDFTVQGQWDIILQNIKIDDSDLSVYSPIVWHSDVLGGNIANDSDVVRQYLKSGGKAVFSGWKLSSALTGIDQTTTIFPPGSYVRDHFYIDTILSSTTTQVDFKGAESLDENFPDIMVDSIKISILGGKLHSMDVIKSFVSTAIPEEQGIPLYNYISSEGSSFHNMPVAGRTFLPKVFYFHFPLYYMERDSARKLLGNALLSLGAVVFVDEDIVDNYIPDKFMLYQNYPNPFNPSTIIKYELAQESKVKLQVFDILGNEIKTLVNENQKAGSYEVNFNAQKMASGIYFYRLTANDFTDAKRMLLIK